MDNVPSRILVQAGTDAFVESHGYLYFYYWYEDYEANGTDLINYYGLAVQPGTQMYVEADSNLTQSSVYYLFEGGGVNTSFTPNWPASNGNSAECLVEDPAPLQGGSREILGNFGTITYYNCDTDLQGIGTRPYTTYVMKNQSGQTMANPGGFFNSGHDFNVYWRLGS